MNASTQRQWLLSLRRNHQNISASSVSSPGVHIVRDMDNFLALSMSAYSSRALGIARQGVSTTCGSEFVMLTPGVLMAD